LVRALIACALTATAVLGSAVLVGSGHRTVREVSGPDQTAAAVTPRGVAEPAHLSATYVAPQSSTYVALGRLQIARLSVDAFVAQVGWDRDTMAVPNDPSVLGWFGPSARLDDLAGTSLVAGHVSDASDRPGPLASLVRARVGDVVVWRPRSGGVARFRVVAIQRFPRTTGIPPSLFRVDGPHMLRLVTCTNRKAGPTGIHYTDNIVVSAVRE
jgi:hypothetical protein